MLKSSRTVGATSASSPCSLSLACSPTEDERHRVGRMSRMGLSGRGIGHDLQIAVVRRDQHACSCLLSRAHHPSQAFIEHLDRLDRGSQHPGVPHHVGICIICQDEAILAGKDGIRPVSP